MNNENIQKSFWKVYMQIRYYYLNSVPVGQEKLLEINYVQMAQNLIYKK